MIRGVLDKIPEMSHQQQHHQHPPRRVSTLSKIPPRKRKEVENGFYSFKKPATQPSPQPAPKPVRVSDQVPPNRILAGYMAYEFLTNGTLLGQRFDPIRPGAQPKTVKQAADDAGPTEVPQNSYGDVARIAKIPGTHIPGVLNPTQLARWLQM